jgi:hypothetical protein
MRRAAALSLLSLLSAVHSAHAESRSVSASLWTISGREVLVRFAMPTNEVRRLVPSGWPSPSSTQLANYVLNHVSVQAHGAVCPAIDQGYDIGRVDPVSVGAGLYGFEVMFQCAEATGIVVQNAALFDVAPQHIDFARIERNGGGFVQQLFTASRQRLRVPDRGSGQPAGFGSYVRIGFEHVRRSLDRMAFLFGLLLVARCWREKGYILIGLSSGYVAAAIVATAAPITVRMNAAEAWIGFMVAFAAARMTAQERRRPRLTAAGVAGLLLLFSAAALVGRDLQAALLLLGAGIFTMTFLPIAADSAALPVLWLVPTTIFGFLDGFVLPADLAALRLSSSLRPSSLIAFGTGAVLADALVMAGLVGVRGLLSRKGLVVPRPIMKDLAATALASLGTFWLVSRLIP